MMNFQNDLLNLGTVLDPSSSAFIGSTYNTGIVKKCKALNAK